MYVKPKLYRNRHFPIWNYENPWIWVEISRPFLDLQPCALTTQPWTHQWMRQLSYLFETVETVWLCHMQPQSIRVRLQSHVECKSVKAPHVHFNHKFSLTFRVYYERPVVIDSLNLELRQIARFSSNMILNEMSSAKYRLLFRFFLIVQHKEWPLYHPQMVTSRLYMLSSSSLSVFHQNNYVIIRM